MITKIDPRIIDIIENGTKEERLYICEREPVYFAIYYFTEFFKYPIAPFHYEFYDDIKRMEAGELNEAAWIAFRESAKTSIAKVALAVHAICFKKKKYINWDSYDKGNAEAALFDIVVALQTNQRIIADFGQLYFKDKSDKESTMKRVSNFLTQNGVRVEAFSTQESTRGRIYKEQRPDLFILDDVETSKTKDSYPITAKIIEHIKEMKAGLAVGGSILYLGNYITEDGVIAYVMESLRLRNDAVVRLVPVEYNGQITWPGKYVHTKEEAARINATIPDKTRHKVALEAKKEALLGAYETEMNNNPSSADDLVFDRAIIERLITKAQAPRKTIAGAQIWYEYNAKHRYGLGADTAEGTGGDANADVIINYSTTPARVVLTYEDSNVRPDVFAHDIKKHGEMYGQCIVGPEVNNTGYATLAELQKIYDVGQIYRRVEKHKTSGQITKEFGWRTTSKTKPELIAQFKSAVEDGQLEILDKGLLLECKHFTRKDARIINPVDGMTRHFDKLNAAMLAWEMRNYATVKHVEGYVQPAYEKSPIEAGN